jgi:Lar family restriction alleviation protein
MNEKKLKSELLPCPFCGSDKVRIVHADFIRWTNLTTNYYCICDNCDTWLAVSDTKQDAINKWNMRPNG